MAEKRVATGPQQKPKRVKQQPKRPAYSLAQRMRNAGVSGLGVKLSPMEVRHFLQEVPSIMAQAMTDDVEMMQGVELAGVAEKAPAAEPQPQPA